MSEVEKDREIGVGATMPTTSDSDISQLTKAQLQAELVRKEQELRELQQSMANLTSEAEMVTKAAVDGKLDTRGDVTKFTGGALRIMQGINDTLDAVIGPLKKVIGHIDRVSKGDMPEQITEEWKGDFNEIRNALNQDIVAISSLVAEAGMLRDATVEGRLDTRGDVSKFSFDYAKIIRRSRF